MLLPIQPHIKVTLVEPIPNITLPNTPAFVIRIPSHVQNPLKNMMYFKAISFERFEINLCFFVLPVFMVENQAMEFSDLLVFLVRLF